MCVGVCKVCVAVKVRTSVGRFAAVDFYIDTLNIFLSCSCKN